MQTARNIGRHVHGSSGSPVRGGRAFASGVLACIFLLALSLPAAAHGPAAVAAHSEAPLQVVYATEQGREAVDSYPVKLLRLALEKSGRPYELHASPFTMNEARARALLREGRGRVTVAWFGTSRQFERELLPVRIPLYRGLLGHRLLLIRRDKQPTFDAVHSVADLRPLLALQGRGWSDVKILSAAGLHVETAPYRKLFPMLVAGRGDYFPRGVTEAYTELDHFAPRNPGLAVEARIELVYPFAMFFFVNRDDHALHDAIRDGLLKAYQDGSFRRLFARDPEIRAALKRAHLAQRRTLRIDNPLMTPQTLAIPARYWYRERSHR